MIYEVVIVTVDSKNKPHVAPMGISIKNKDIILKPFKPSQTLENILNTKIAVLNVITDVRVFAACITGREQFDLEPIDGKIGFRLKNTISYSYLSLENFLDDNLRPQLIMKEEKTWQVSEFLGLNRAQAAVIEGAILTSRLNILSINKIREEMKYLSIAISKTAGPKEKEAWEWLEEAVDLHTTKNIKSKKQT
ncbi:MAG: DUF447 domain-containing protein [Burkholderiaceae bacterium]